MPEHTQHGSASVRDNDLLDMQVRFASDWPCRWLLEEIQYHRNFARRLQSEEPTSAEGDNAVFRIAQLCVLIKRLLPYIPTGDDRAELEALAEEFTEDTGDDDE